MRLSILIMLPILMACSVRASTSEPFAIKCKGKAVFADNLSGKRKERNYNLPYQTYVFDEEKRTVKRALEPRQEYDNVCFRGGYIDSVSFSPGLINVTSEAQGQRCDFTVNRSSGKAEYFSHDDLAPGQYSEMKWTMTCSATKIPSFDRSKNRF